MNRNRDEIETIRYPSLLRYEKEISHFTSTRYGGVSDGNFASLNLGRFTGDSQQNIDENFRRFCNHVNIPRERFHLPYQTHENHVLKIDEDFLSQSHEIQTEHLKGIDALITNIPNECICVSTADCVPVLLYDPVQKAISAIHAGWRGTCSRIAQNAVETMQSNYGTEPADIIAIIGASISPEAYEVGDELLGFFRKADFDTDKIFFKKGEKYHLDLWKANQQVLIEAGIQHIEIAGYCTFTEHQRFFSARRLGIKSGRILSGIMLR